MGVMACTPGGCGVQTGWGRITFFAPDSGVAVCQIDCSAYQPKLSNTGAYFSSDPSSHFHEIIGGKMNEAYFFQPRDCHEDDCFNLEACQLSGDEA
jgi:hypothetical protein